MPYRSFILKLVTIVTLVGGGMALNNYLGPDQPPETVAMPPPAAQAAVTTPRPTLMEFGMDSCASCRAMKGQLDQLRARYPETLRVVTVNLLEQRALAEQWRIRAMPTQILLDAEGQEVDRHLGFITADALLARFAVAGVSLDPASGSNP
ncbi:MAG: thioredoxin family protein [Chromatiaceae bacterium]|nr:thioredoxin family protein [Chromatiaceae bacterium]